LKRFPQQEQQVIWDTLKANIKVKADIALPGGTPPQSYGTSLAIWHMESHSVICHPTQVNATLPAIPFTPNTFDFCSVNLDISSLEKDVLQSGCPFCHVTALKVLIIITITRNEKKLCETNSHTHKLFQ